MLSTSIFSPTSLTSFSSPSFFILPFPKAFPVKLNKFRYCMNTKILQILTDFNLLIVAPIVCVLPLSTFASRLAQLTSWLWMLVLRHSRCRPRKCFHSSGSELSRGIAFSPPVSRSEGLPRYSLRVRRDNGCGFVGFCNTQEHGSFISKFLCFIAITTNTQKSPLTSIPMINKGSMYISSYYKLLSAINSMGRVNNSNNQ